MSGENSSQITLLPLPAVCRGGEPLSSSNTRGSDERPKNPVTRNGGLTWPGEFDARVESRVSELLDNVDCGNFEINIAKRAGDYPAMDDEERYTLYVDAEGISLSAPTTWGALHGVTTLWQLQSAGQLQDTGWAIDDRPRFSWRGVLIDVARHFIPLVVLLRVVDGMARLKMNVLHLHLTDDQGFRFTSTAFPKLASEAAYSQAELGQLVAYAAARGVRVVPELDVPGHVNSWLVNYPEWGLAGVSATVKFGVHDACLNPHDESVYAALKTLFAEVGEVFPDRYVHIGGDEVHPAWWRADADVQNFIVAHDLQDERGMQAYFNRRVHADLTAQGKRVIGWDEVLHPQMPNLIVQNWRGVTNRDTVLAKSLDCIVSAGYYLDLFYPADIHYQFDPQLEQSQLIALEEEMKNDPRLAHISAGLRWTDQWRNDAINIAATSIGIERGRVLGGEACLWCELVDTETLETRLWSRLPAIAERLWSPAATTDVHDFYRRLYSLLDMPGFELTALQHRRLRDLGLTDDQITVAAVLEPVKWYARLLGDQALQARLSGEQMPQARPYDMHSELRRVVDHIAPESFAALALSQAVADDLRVQCVAWAGQDPACWPQDTRAAIAGLRKVGQAMLNLLDSDSPDQAAATACGDLLRALYVPHGEYMIAAILPLLNWLQLWIAGER